MGHRTILSGRFDRIDMSYLSQKANETGDQRHVFYKAMLEHDTYEAYEAAVAGIKIKVPTYRADRDPITGRDEILYARRNARIKDSPG
jgi:hypothetical protein